MRYLSPSEFFKLDWYISSVDVTSSFPDLATGDVCFHLLSETKGAEPDEDMISMSFPWIADITESHGKKTIQVGTELNDCWLFCDRFVFEQDTTPSDREVLAHFDALNWRDVVKKSLSILGK